MTGLLGLPRRLAVAIASADLIITSRVTHHIDGDALAAFYRQAAAVLRPGGWLADVRPGVRPDAWDKATGGIRYNADLPVPAGMLEAVLVRSPFPHAQVTGIAAEEARAVPGVVAVVTAADLPGGLTGRRVRDMPLLASGVARFAGEPVAVVLAQSRDAAEAAAALVDVDYQERAAVTDALAALGPDSPLVHEAPWEYPGAVVTPADGRNLQSLVSDGDPEAVSRALAGSATVVSATHRSPAGHQGYLEPLAWLAFPPADGITRLRGTTKSPYRLRGQGRA